MQTKFETIILKNGLTVKQLRNPHLHSACIGLYTKKLPEPVCGIGHLTEHMFFRRLAELSQRQLYHETDRIGSTLHAATYANFIGFDIIAPPSRLTEAFALICRMFGDFTWTAEEIYAEKEVVKRQIEEKYRSMYTKAKEDYYRGTPMGDPIMGTRSDLRRMSAKGVNAYRKAIMAPGNCCVVFTGHYHEKDWEHCIETLEKLPPRPLPAAPLQTPEFTGFTQRTAESDCIYPSDDEYSDVCLSFDVDTAKVSRYAAEFLHSILGCGVTSLLSQKLREEMGLITEIYGETEFSEYGGRMTFAVEAHTAHLAECLQAAFGLLKQARGRLTQKDLDANTVFYTENQYRLLDDPGELNFQIGWRDFMGGEISSIEDLVSRYAAVTIDAVNHAAIEIFKPENLIISVSNGKYGLKKGKLTDTIASCRKELG